MRKQWWWGLGALVLVGCVAPGLGKPSAGGEVPIPPGKGLVVVSWKGEVPGRAIVGSAWASANADLYELVLLGASGARPVAVNLGAGQAVPVDPGTYRVLVLAGAKRSSGSSVGYLVGSAWVDAIVVTAGQRTPVDLVLRSVDLTLGPLSPAYWKTGLTVGAAGKTRNPRVGMLLAGPSTTARPRFRSTELWNGYRDASVVTGTPGDWAAEATATVPDGVPSVSIALVGAGICLQGFDDQWVPTAGLTKNSWYWPNRSELPDGHPLIPFTEIPIPCAAPPTGVSVGLAWE